MPKIKIEKTESGLKAGVVIALIVVTFMLAMKITNSSPCEQRYRQDTTIKLTTGQLTTEVVKEQTERMMGLSGRRCINGETAMLFVFDEADRHGIWMKDMNFPIDIIWLNEEKKIVHIEKNVLPGSYPKIFYPSSPALYVVEVQSGLTDSKSITVGQQLSW